MNIQIKQKKEDLEKELRKIVSVIIKNHSPEKVILFGSPADGNIHEWSNINSAFIKETEEKFIDRLHNRREEGRLELWEYQN